ncbi:MAG: hypothetical protein ACREH4_12325 [Vitreimonas sp.]
MSNRTFLVAALAATLAALGAVASAEPNRATRAGSNAAPIEEVAPSPATRVRPGQVTRPPIVVGPTIVEATTSFSCSNANGTTTTYTVSVEGGSCYTNGTTNSKPTAASCRNNTGQLAATANCAGGCGGSSGSGGCTQVTAQ